MGQFSYRKKPVEIEAFQYLDKDGGDVTRAYPGWLLEAFKDGTIVNHVDIPGALWIKTLEGGHICIEGDWIIRGIKGELYPCKPDIFAATYDKVP